VIAWELDPTGVAGLHRIRWKANEGDAWTTEDWTDDPATFSASITLSPLDPEHQSYWAEAQSASDTGNENTFTAWAALDPAYFYTLCSGTFGMANWLAQKITQGKLSWLRLSWTTTVDMNWAQIDSQTSEPGDASWSSGDTSHMRNYNGFAFDKSGTYYWRTRNRNKCLVWCSYSAWKYFTVGGPPDYNIVAQG
jgi:hypothetical protein